VHASELADPTPYLDGGELLLSVGMRLDPAVRAAALNEHAAAYVRRLVEVGVVGLGFGVGVQQPRCRPRWSPRPTRWGWTPPAPCSMPPRPAQSAARPGWPPSWTPAGVSNPAVGVDKRFRLWVRTRSFTVLPALVGVWCDGGQDPGGMFGVVVESQRSMRSSGKRTTRRCQRRSRQA
jgi:hypothetical protein